MRYLVLFFALLTFTALTAQDQPEYSRVKILFDESNTIEKLNTLGVLCHGNHAKGRHFTSDFSTREIRIIKDAGFEIEIIIEDVQAHYVEQNNHPHHYHNHRNAVDCADVDPVGIPTPDNFELGSMGGFLTYAEILVELDEMKALYPNLISTKAPISSTLLTHEGRELIWVRISDNPEMDESEEPEILYNSLTHSREPLAMMQMIYYMWYLLENYDNDDEIKYLVDNIEMYFIPCVNPDGYVYNENTNPNGGGLWRKNRRNNGGGSYGVDLNRNFDYAYAYDDSGSSPNPNSEQYRGPSAMSEPETQLLKIFIENHDFKIAMNYHSYSNLLLRPWGHIDDLPQDIATFDAFGQLMVQENEYAYGGSEVIGYYVNGDSDSYMYGAHDIISYTPEVGNSFWPPIADIVNDAEDNLLPNLYAARFVLNYGHGEEMNAEETISEYNGTIDFNIKKYGFKDGDLTVSLQSDDFVAVSSSIPLALTHLQEGITGFNYQLNPDLENGSEIVFSLIINNGEQDFIQEFKKTFNTDNPNDSAILSDAGDNMDNWQNGTAWGITNARYYSAPTSIADSPQSDYQAGNTTYLNLNTPLDLTNATSAYISFKAEWDIEAEYDYCQLQASTEISPFEPLCGLYTKEGSIYQDNGEPIWDGVKSDWVTEELLLDDYLGYNDINLQFRLYADNFVQGDGFFFDDFIIVVVSDNNTSTYEFTANDFSIKTFPNPTSTTLNLSLSDIPENGRIEMYNQLGQIVYSDQIISQDKTIDISFLANGLYYYSIFSEDKMIGSRKIMVSK